MATFYGSGVGGNWPSRMTIKTVATIVSQDIANNTSTINLKVYAYYNYTQYNTVNPTNGFQYIRIDEPTGSTNYAYSGSGNFDYAGTSSTNTVKIMDWTSSPITHNSDGTKTINIDVYQDCPGVTTLDYMYSSFDWTLDTIPRASVPTLSASSVALGSAVTITTNRVSTSFTHTINYTLGTRTTEQAVTTGVTDSYAWTLPADLANALPSSTSGTLTFYVHTYSGATYVGTKTISMTVTIPNTATYQPSTSVALEEAAAAMVGAGFWLAGKSAIKATTTASYKYGATHASYAVSIDGVAYATSPATSAVIATTGTKTVTVTVTDSRGFQGSASATANFISLPAPTRSASSVEFGNAVTIYTNRPTTGVTSTLYYAIGTIGNTSIATGVGASYDWTVPTSAIGGFTNATSGTITITQNFYNGANYLGASTVTLTGTIAKSVPTTNVSTVALGGAVTVYTNRDHASLSHKLHYQFGSSSKTFIADIAVANSSYAWTTTSALANLLTAAKSGTLTFTLDTYNGNALIGSLTKTITVTIPSTSEYLPTVSGVATEGTANMVGSGAYIAGHSSIKLTSTGAGKLGASISSYAVTINGSAYSGPIVTSSVIASSGNISVSVTVTDSRGYTATHSFTVPFDAIVAPTFNLTTVALGSAITITTNRPSANIKNTIKYTYGSQAATLATLHNSDTYSWTLANSMASGLPSSVSGAVTVTQESYYNAVLLGTKTATFTATIPNTSAFQPVPTIFAITEGATGLTGFNNTFIQSKSRITVDSRATYKFDATLSKFDVTIDGVAYSGSPVTSAIITKSGSITIKVKVTDSRGYFSEITDTRNVEAYEPPKITTFTAVRSPTDQSTDMSNLINFSISPVANLNSKSYAIEYRVAGSEIWTEAHSSILLYSLNTTLSKSGILSNSSTYEVRLTVSDSFTSALKTVTVRSGFSLMDFRSTGKGIAFGKVSESDLMEVALDMNLIGSKLMFDGVERPYDSIIASGTDLDTVRTTGTYYCPANATVATLLNCPTPSAFSLVVTKHAGESQILIPYPTTSHEVWHRNRYSTAWGSWGRIGSSALDAYPVGAIYLSTAATNPGTIFGGTWAAFGTGRTLVGIDAAQTEFNTVEKTGGHKNLQAHTHTGSSGNAGGHGHTASSGNAGGHGHTASSGTTGAHTHTGTAASGGDHGHTASSGTTGSHTHTGTAASAGDHNHEQQGYWRFAPGATGNYGRARNNLTTDPIDTGANNAMLNAGAHTHSVTTVAAGDHAHTVSVTAVGGHTHSVSTVSAGDHAHTVSVTAAADHAHTVSVVAAADHAHTVTVGSTGAGNAENLQPYITVYMWKRTA